VLDTSLPGPRVVRELYALGIHPVKALTFRTRYSNFPFRGLVFFKKERFLQTHSPLFEVG
jgi:hypothetical protein